jgi:hypothetical protein
MANAESPITTINNLAQSVIDTFYNEDCSMDKLAYTEDVMRQIKNICYSLSTKKYYVRVCQNNIGELDIENMQIYTEEDIREEFVAIDYVDEDEVNNLSIEDLQEIAMNNNEYLEEIEVIRSL